MALKRIAAKIFANIIAKRTQKWVNNPISTQKKVFQSLLKAAENTQFGKDHGFKSINDYTAFAQKVPIRDYEQLKPYVEQIINGESDVLWPGKPIYFAKTSGTTSGVKYIPITKTSIRNQVNASRNAILNYIHETGECRFRNRQNDFSAGESYPRTERRNSTWEAFRNFCALCSKLSSKKPFAQLGHKLH